MSFFTALADAYGGYGQGKQQRYQDTLAQQQQQTQQQQADIESQKWKAQQRAILQNQGTDPDTNQPYVMPKSLTNVSGGLPNKGHATLQQLVDWHTARAHFYRTTGQTDNATDEENYALGLQGIQGQQATSQATLQRELLLRSIMPPYQQAELAADAQYGWPGMRMPAIGQWNIGQNLPPWFRANPTATNPALTTEGKIVGQVKGTAAEEQQKFKADLAAAIKIPLDPITKLPIDPKTGKSYTAKLNQQEQDTLTGVQGDLAQAQDPKTVAALVKEWAVSPNATFNSLVKEYGKFRTDQLDYVQRQGHYTKNLEQQQTQQQQQAQQGYGGGGYGGGSYGPVDPHYPPP